MVRCLLFVLILVLAWPVIPGAVADNTAQPQGATPDQKIRITADRLVADTKTGRAEFSGNVRAAQGSTVITSDRLEVLYDQARAGDAAGGSEAAIRSIVSSGNVVIHFDDKVATTEKAVYQSKTGIFTLTGKGTRVTSGDNTITGEKITVDRKSDRMTVESGGASRVNAIIFTGQEGLAIPASGATPEEKPGGQP
jgi:lipopolysaccharide export system protein LptA